MFNRFAIAAAICLTAAACASGPPEPLTPKAQPSAHFANIDYATWTNDEPPYRLYPGDELDIETPSAPELSKTVTVQPDGRITLPLLPPLMVADRSVPAAEALITRAYASQLLRPEVIITVKAATLKVFVGGEVDKPGIYDMPGDIDALDAVIMAGGFKTSAKRNGVIIIRRGSGGRPMMRTANLLRGITDPNETDAVPLRRFDVVYVPRTGVAEAGLVVQQYLRDVVPMSLGYDYSAGPDYASAAIGR